MNTLKNNIFDDDMIEKALSDLNKIWHKVPVTKSFFITQYGNVDTIIGCLKNLDEGVILNALKCILTLLHREEGAQDIFIRHKGVLTLNKILADSR